jgi:DNA-binding MarR family transcriptional regulator
MMEIQRAGPRGQDQLVQAIQLFVTEGGRLFAAFAARQGLHPTDVHALLHVMLAERRGAALTAGGLGAELDLTSSAVTALVDRLERAGHVSRARDAVDRRKVLLHYSAAGRALAESFFEPLNERMEPLVGAYTDAELATVIRFLGEASDAFAAHRSGLAGGSPPGT